MYCKSDYLRELHDEAFTEKRRPPQKWVGEEGDEKLKEKFK